MFTLIAIGIGTAYVYSVMATLAPGIFPASFRGHGGGVPVYFEAAARAPRARARFSGRSLRSRKTMTPRDLTRSSIPSSSWASVSATSLTGGRSCMPRR